MPWIHTNEHGLKTKIRHLKCRFLTLRDVLGLVFEAYKPRVENFGSNQLQRRSRIIGENRLPTCAAKNDGKDHEPEPVNKAQLHQAPDYADAANRAHRVAWLTLKNLDFIPQRAFCKARVLPCQRLLELAGKNQFGEFVHSPACLINSGRRELCQGLIGNPTHDQQLGMLEIFADPLPEVPAEISKESSFAGARSKAIQRNEQIRGEFSHLAFPVEDIRLSNLSMQPALFYDLLHFFPVLFGLSIKRLALTVYRLNRSSSFEHLVSFRSV